MRHVADLNSSNTFQWLSKLCRRFRSDFFNDASMGAKFQSFSFAIAIYYEACSRNSSNTFQWLSKLCRRFRRGFFNDTSMGAKFHPCLVLKPSTMRHAADLNASNTFKQLSKLWCRFRNDFFNDTSMGAKFLSLFCDIAIYYEAYSRFEFFKHL